MGSNQLYYRPDRPRGKIALRNSIHRVRAAVLLRLWRLDGERQGVERQIADLREEMGEGVE